MSQTDLYKDLKPELVLENYFNGPVQAQGVFIDRFGILRRRFKVDIASEWDQSSQILKLTEDFIYDDGETEQRIWTLNKKAENHYSGTAPNVIGSAEGKTTGNAFHMKYVFDLSIGSRKIKIKFKDWMFLLDDHTLFNKATLSKWGIRIGDVYIFFTKPGQ